MRALRQRWLRIQHKSSLNKITKNLKTHSYSEENKSGFDLIEISERTIKARFIEEKQISETIILPFGETETVTSIKYIIFPFVFIQLSLKLGLLKLINPPASLKSFIKKIEIVCEDDFSISKIKFELADLIEFLTKNESIDRHTINKLKVGAIPYSKTTIASLKLQSTSNAYEEFLKLHKHDSYKLEKITMTARISGQSEIITVSSTGAISSTPGFDCLIAKYMKKESQCLRLN
jgi:hypothetical protein